MSQYSSQSGNTLNNQPKAERRSILSSNPIMRRLNRIDERTDTGAATYGGITAKTIIFLLFSLAGIVLQLVMTKFLAIGEVFVINYRGFETSMYTGEAVAVVAVTVLAIVFQLLAFFVRGSTPVTGALYCITQGYVISFLIFKVLRGYEYLGALALAITLMIILVMSILYTKGIIKVNKKFKMVLLTLVITSVGISLLSFIAYFIPFTRPLVVSMRGNLPLTIGVSVLFIIIAALFLISDFDTIDHVVNDGLPKKYEWMAAFGLSFTVLWLYLKVLDLIITIAGSKKN